MAVRVTGCPAAGTGRSARACGSWRVRYACGGRRILLRLMALRASCEAEGQRMVLRAQCELRGRGAARSRLLAARVRAFAPLHRWRNTTVGCAARRRR